MGAIEDVLGYIATNDIRWVDLQFHDINGRLHRVSISARLLDESAFGRGLDVADLTKVFGPAKQQDLYLRPDPETLARIPWEPSTVRFVCDIVSGEERFVKDPRYVAERIETNLKAAGVSDLRISSEVDCYIFDSVAADKAQRRRGAGVLMDSREAVWSPNVYSNSDTGAYLSTPNDGMYSARSQIGETLEDSFGILVESHRHGEAPTAHQSFKLGSRGLVYAADAVSTLKFVTKNLANAVNGAATFMPYPIEGEKGSGMIIEVSAWKSESDVLFNSKGELNQKGQYFVAGILDHLSAICAFTAATPNSYRRFARNNFSADLGKSNSILSTEGKIKFKAADPSANPYLAFAAVVAAGFDGIKNKKSVKKKVKLPKTLEDAIASLESDSKFLKGVIPSELLSTYIDIKSAQHKEVMLGVTTLELQEYFDV